MLLLILFLLLAIAVSFICSILEAILLSVTVSYIKTREMEGSRNAALLGEFKSNIDRPLAAILSVNTIAHTVGAAGVGAQAVVVFGEAYFGWISAILTLLILIFSEIIPKSLGARYWRELALPSASVLMVLVYASWPLVIISQWITRLFSARDEQKSISRSEISAMASVGAQEGVFDKSEADLIQNLMKLKSLKVRTIMTPRMVMVAAPEDMLLTDFFKNKDFLRFSRIPVYHKNIDNITGYVLKYDVLDNLANDKFELKLKDIKREMLVTFKNFTIPILFGQLLEKKEHIALIVDEYGGVEGLVTLEDIFETLFGLEITDETDLEEDMQKLARERWLKRAKAMKIDLSGDFNPK
jgi:CBS domain containing-hemolysin-like protein